MIGYLPDLGYGLDTTWTSVSLWNEFARWWNQF